MLIKPSYRKPLTAAVLLHVLVIALLLLRLPAHQVRMPGPVAEHDSIKAVAINPQQVQQRVAAIKEQQQKAQQQQLALQKAQQREKRQLQQLRQQRLAMEKKIAVEKARALKLKNQRLAEQKQQQLLQRQQQLQKAMALKQLQDEQMQLQQRLQQEKHAQEQAQQARAQAAQAQGVIDEYAARIKAAIESNLLTPSNYQKGQSCVYQVRVAPGGQVLSVSLLRSSGNTALDEAARAAIYRTSPLPVPGEAALFDKFRELRLTLNPYENLAKDSL